MIRSLEPLDIFGCIYPRPRKQWDLIGGLGVHQLGPNRRRSPINPELPIVLPGDGLVTLMQIDAPTYSRIWHNSSPVLQLQLLLLRRSRCCSSVPSGLLNEVKTSRLSRNVQFWLNLGERGGWMFVFSGLAHSHDNGLSVATFPPTAPPQDMLTRRGWWLVCTTE